MTDTNTKTSGLLAWFRKRRRYSSLFDMSPYQLDDLGLSGADISDALELRRQGLFWSPRRRD